MRLASPSIRRAGRWPGIEVGLTSFGLPPMVHNALKDTGFMLKAAAYKWFAGIGEGMLCTRWCVYSHHLVSNSNWPSVGRLLPGLHMCGEN